MSAIHWGDSSMLWALLGSCKKHSSIGSLFEIVVTAVVIPFVLGVGPI